VNSRKNSKVFTSIIGVVSLGFIGFVASRGDLLLSNLSRISNSDNTLFVVLLIGSLLLGIVTFRALRRTAYVNLAYFGVLSMFIGCVVPYNYLDQAALTSNLHLIFAYISMAFILVLNVLILLRCKLVKPKLARVLFVCLAIVVGIEAYLYGTYLFMNSLGEVIFLTYVVVSETIVYNMV